MNDCFDLHLDLHQKAKGTCVFIFRVSNYYARKKLYDDYGCRDTDFVLAFLYFCTIHSVKLILKPLDSVLDSFGEWALSKS
jgi:hypothetical protein